MQVHNQITECIKIVQENFEGKHYFENPILFTKNEYQVLFKCFGVAAHKNKLMLMDREEFWHRLEFTDINAVAIASLLLENLNDLKKALV